MTIDDLLAFPEDDAWRYELVEAVLVRMAGSRPKAVRVSTRLFCGSVTSWKSRS